MYSMDDWEVDRYGNANLDDVLKESITMGIPLIDGSGFSKETNITVFPIVEKSNDGFQTVVNRNKNGKTGSNSNSTNHNGVKISGQSVKSNVKYVPKVAVSVAKTGASNVVNTSKFVTSHAPSIPKNKPPKEREEEVENVFDESVNLLRSAITGASSSPYTVSDG
ncbi:hypothetical protein Tco_0591622 [Tanacetum coccineum]